MKVKNHYQKEIIISGTQRKNGSSNNKNDVIKIQSWLSLYGKKNSTVATTTSIDGDFGPATEQAVKNFQEANGLSRSGIVSEALFTKLSEPMSKAFESPLSQTALRKIIIEVAENHLNQIPRESFIKNETNTGPWVKAYMGGKHGKDQLWCVGFVQTIMDQAFSHLNRDFREAMNVTVSCDQLAKNAKEKGAFISRLATIQNRSLIKPGDIFMRYKNDIDLWDHVGIIQKVEGDVIETIEGNTTPNSESNNGDGAYKRVRNLLKAKYDIFSIEQWV